MFETRLNGATRFRHWLENENILKKKKLAPLEVLGAVSEKDKFTLFFSSKMKGLEIAECVKDLDFQYTKTGIELPSLENCTHLQFGKLDVGYFLLIDHETLGLRISFSKDRIHWNRAVSALGDDKRATAMEIKTGAIISNYQKNGAYFLILGGNTVRVATSIDAKTWTLEKQPHLKLPMSGSEKIEIDLAERIERGILICYRLIHFHAGQERHQVQMAVLDPNDITQVLWNSPSPIWENSRDWGQTSFGAAVIRSSEIYGFWNTAQFGLMLVRYPIEGIPFQLPPDHAISLQKEETNPVLCPRGDFAWESFATYNPAAFTADGKIHILYRAQGDNLISSIGYANSIDGINITERSETPVFQAQEVFDTFQKLHASDVEQKYISGGGIAGAEDPRVTLIDERLYMTYVAFDGASPPRVALTSIAISDFLAQRWLWQKPILISPPGVVDKSAVIFPEKVKGKYVIMHRIYPDILIDYVADLNFDGTHWLETKQKIKPRAHMWDSRKIGAGAPPLKTPEGWLLIYYGVDDRHDKFYKMGAMLLDLEDPSLVLYRSSTPILEPLDWYENSGFKPGIVYPCGAVQLGDNLLVYYGGADCVVCVASRNLKDFIQALKSNSELKMETQRPLKIGPYATHKIKIEPTSEAQLPH
jgi:predicted GH43/DUF377 family glycosyl hydrolase